MVRGAFVLSGGVGFVNAVRRTLLTDVVGAAPCEVTVRANTSCLTDEYLAHRIGLVPMRRTGPGDALELDAAGPAVVLARDLTSPAFEPVHGDVELAVLGEGQRLRLSVRVDERPARAHARYAHCAAVGMRPLDAERCELAFETNDDRDPRAALLEALDHLDARCERALHELAHQPAEPPRSFC
jgi:DNA-directed RNA polymerase alpha subunit